MSRIDALLDQLKPTRLVVRSYVQADTHSRMRIYVAHDSDPEADLEIRLIETSAEIWGLFANDEMYNTSHDPADQWEDDVIETTRDLLSGRYAIEEMTWRGRRVKVTVTDSWVMHGNWSPTRRCGGRFSHQWFAGRARPHDERSITASIVSIRAQRIE